MENFHNTGCISNGEWHMEHGVRESFSEDKAISHKVGLGKLAVLQDEICEEQLKSLAACTWLSGRIELRILTVNDSNLCMTISVKINQCTC